MIKISKLATTEVDRFKTIRLRSLKEDPDSFGTTYEEASLWTQEKWATQLETIHGFIASAGEKDVGIVRIAIDKNSPQTGWIISMWVAPEARCNKIGSLLIDAAIQWSRQSNLKCLKLDVGDSNQAAISLYGSKGFMPNGIVGSLPRPRAHIKEHQRELNL